MGSSWYKAPNFGFNSTENLRFTDTNAKVDNNGTSINIAQQFRAACLRVLAISPSTSDSAMQEGIIAHEIPLRLDNTYSHKSSR